MTPFARRFSLWCRGSTVGLRLEGAVGRVMLLGVNLFVLLQILRTFERFTADVAGMILERDVNADVGCDVVSLGTEPVLIL